MNLPTQPLSTTTVFLDQITFSDEQLAPLRVSVCELSIPAHNDDGNVIVMNVGPVSFHMNRRQLNFLATAITTAAASDLTERVEHELNQTKEVN